MEPDRFEVDRRQLLKATGVGASGLLLAGCSAQQGQSNGSNNGSGGSGSGGSGSAVMKLPTDNNYNDLNLNPYNGNPENGIGSGSLFYEPLITYHEGLQKRVGMFVKDWNLDGKTFTIKFRNGYTWADGTPLTSKDIRIQAELESFVFERDTFNSYKTPDKHTLELEVDSTNPKIVLSKLPGVANVKADIFEKYLKKFKNAKNDSARSKLRTKLLQDVKITEPYSSGPWKITKISSQRVVGKLRKDHPRAKNINIDQIQSQSFSDQASVAQAAISGNIDETGGQLPQTTIKQLTDGPWNWIKIPVPVGGMNAFSPESTFFGVKDDKNEYKVGHRKERQAIAHLLDLDKISKLGGKPVGEPTWQTAMSPKATSQYLTDEIRKNMIDYGRKANEKKATQLMKEAGYEKNNGTWAKGGQSVDLQYKYPSGWQESKIWNATTQMLNDFGIQTTKSGIETTTFFSRTVPNQDFDTGFVGIWLATPDGYPYYGFYNNLGSLTPARTDYNNQTPKIKAPPLNKPNASPKPFDFDEKTNKLGRTSDKAEAKRLIQEIAWASNWWMPFVQIFQKQNYVFVNTSDFDLTVPKDSKKLQVGDFLGYVTREGYLKAK